MEEHPFILRAKIIKTFRSGEAWIRVGGIRFSKYGGDEKKKRKEARPPRKMVLFHGHWRLSSHSYIREKNVFARHSFYFIPIDVNPALINVVAHVRALRATRFADSPRYTLKSQSKFYVDPLCNRPTTPFATAWCYLIITPERDRDPSCTSPPIAGSYYPRGWSLR